MLPSLILEPNFSPTELHVLCSNSTPLENIRKPLVFIFTEGIEMEHWVEIS